MNSVALLSPLRGTTVSTPRLAKPLIPDAYDRACLAARTAHENKGSGILVLDLRGLTTEFDFFVIVTGTSRRQVHAIVEEVDAKLVAVGDVRIGLEGYEASKWVIQDYGDVVLHVFDPDMRDYYRLEEKWEDAPKIDWADEE